MTDYEVFLSKWFLKCPEGGHLEIRIKSCEPSKKNQVKSEFFSKYDEAIAFLKNINLNEKQHVWFGVNPRFRLTDEERIEAFTTEYAIKLKERGGLVDKNSDIFRKGLLEMYGEIGGRKEYIRSSFCRQTDFDCVKSDEKNGSSDEDYAKMQSWADKLAMLMEDNDGNGFIIGSGNGIQLFTFQRKLKTFSEKDDISKFENDTKMFGKQIMDSCPDELVIYDTSTSDIARVMRLPGFANPKGERQAKILKQFNTDGNYEYVVPKKGALADLLKMKVPNHGRYSIFTQILGNLANKQVPADEARNILEKFNQENCADPAPSFYLDNAMSSYEIWKAKAKEKITTEKPEKNLTEEHLKILSDPQLFERITIEELDKRIVGEIETRQTIFLCGCGIWVENHNTASYNLMQSAESGAGKDYTLNATLEIFPKEIFLKRTRISGKVLSYWHRSDKEPDWNWNGKILYLEDVSQELMDSPVVKVFLSNGSFATILINQIATDLEVKGKPVTFFSSAKAKFDREQGRRVPMLRCDESNNQTKKIIHRQAECAVMGKVITQNLKLTEALVHLKRVKVKIPYALGIEENIPANNIILRTHFPRLLDYIRASCALFQYQREKDGEYLLATQQDYEYATLAFRKITSNPFSIPLSHEEQKMLEKIDELQATKTLELKNINQQARLIQESNWEGFTFDELEPHIQFWRDTQLREELRKLTSVGLLITGKRKKEEGKSGRSALTYRRPDLTKIELPSWKKVNKTETTETTEINKTTEITETIPKEDNHTPKLGVNSVNSIYSAQNQGTIVSVKSNSNPSSGFVEEVDLSKQDDKEVKP